MYKCALKTELMDCNTCLYLTQFDLCIFHYLIIIRNICLNAHIIYVYIKIMNVYIENVEIRSFLTIYTNYI